MYIYICICIYICLYIFIYNIHTYYGGSLIPEMGFIHTGLSSHGPFFTRAERGYSTHEKKKAYMFLFYSTASYSEYIARRAVWFQHLEA